MSLFESPATISLVNPDKSVNTISVYWLGVPYETGVGETLIKYYTDLKRVKEMINLGKLDRLGKYLEPAPVTRRFGFDPLEDPVYAKMDVGEKYEWMNDSENYTKAYHRDRGDELRIKHYNSIKDYEQNVFNDFEMRFNYIFKPIPKADYPEYKWYIREYINVPTDSYIHDIFHEMPKPNPVEESELTQDFINNWY